jgi:long-chain acyl-CoA synthetase
MARLKYWNNLLEFGSATAVYDASRQLACSYKELHLQMSMGADLLGRERKLVVLLFGSNDFATIALYLSALEAGHSLLISPVSTRHPAAGELIDKYRPEIVLSRDGAWQSERSTIYCPCEQILNYICFRRRTASDPPPYKDIGLLLLTSGSSGDAKTVRLSFQGVDAGAQAVAEALRMGEGVRVLGSLPFAYVYGLTVLNSVLQSGSAIHLLSGSAADPLFWKGVAAAGITMLPAVSQTLAFMRHHDVKRSTLSSLKQITHSGEPLELALFGWIYEQFAASGVDIYLMYGQTEAGGRISVLPPEQLPGRHRSVGKAISTAQISISPSGEILVRGASVMLGYAQRREDLSGGGDQIDALHTGDFGYLDANGFLFVTGRLSRDRKIFGKRINLDAIEAYTDRNNRAAVVEDGGLIYVVAEASAAGQLPSIAGLAGHFQVPPQAFRMRVVEKLPRGDRGKVAYDELIGSVRESNH